jgi:hypothetical protein
MYLYLLTLLSSLQLILSADVAVFQLTSTASFNIPPDFASFSVEVGTTFDILTFNNAPRNSYINLMKHLKSMNTNLRGPNLRIGGNSADQSEFVPASTPLRVNDTYRISVADLSAYSAAVKQWNGTIVMGVNMRSHIPDLALLHVQAIAENIGFDSDFIDSIEVGNENDVFFENYIRSPNYTANDYIDEFDNFTKYLTPITGPNRIQGLTWCKMNATWNVKIPQILQTYVTDKPVFHSLSYHAYALSACNGNKNNRLWMILEDKAAIHKAEAYAPIISEVLAYNIPMRIGEGNSISCGGVAGISDTMASALWAIDILYNMALLGVSRWNFHGGTGGPYSPVHYANPDVIDAVEPMPIYYAQWFFTFATAQSTTLYQLQNISTTSTYIKGFSGRDENGIWRLTFLYKDMNATENANVTIIATSPLTKAASVYLLTAPSVSSTSGLYFGGQTFDGTSNGIPAGTFGPDMTVMPTVPGTFTISLPPCSAAVVMLPTV